MFKYAELEKMFIDPLDNIIFLANKKLMRFKFLKTIFS